MSGPTVSTSQGRASAEVAAARTPSETNQSHHLGPAPNEYARSSVRFKKATDERLAPEGGLGASTGVRPALEADERLT